MKNILLIIALLLIIPLSSALDFSYMTGGDNLVKDLSFSQKYSCLYNMFQGQYNNSDWLTNFVRSTTSAAKSLVIAGSVNWDPLSLFPGVVNAGESFLSKYAYCADAYVSTKIITEQNNITMTYGEYSAKYSGQIGVEDFLFDVERAFVKSNAADVWDYVRLLLNIIMEFISVVFYMFEFYIVIYILLIAIPKAFLKIRDGVSMLLVRGKKKEEKKDTGRKDFYYHYEYTRRD